MKIARRIFVEIVKRAVDEVERPRLFDDRWSPKRARRRLDRLRRWAGLAEFVVAIEAIQRREIAYPDRAVERIAPKKRQ